MSEQDGAQSTIKEHGNHKTSTINQQNGKQANAAQRPLTNDPKTWKVYWKAQGWPWRTEPEIDSKRQKYLTERCAIIADISQGIYPFKDIKLSRADVEWLLTTLENGRGPVDWSDESQRRREGLDLRGANLNQTNLSNLPLARMRGGLPWDEWNEADESQRAAAAALIRESDLHGAHLEGARFRGTHLERADLRFTYLEETHFRFTHLDRANLSRAKLKGTDLYAATLNDEKGIGPCICDMQWGDVNLSVVKWSHIEILGDESEARQRRREGKAKDNALRLNEYEIAVRANHQLAVALQSQGLNVDAARFAYRAQLCQRIVLRRQKKFGQYLFSSFLNLLAGYGYRPGRSVIWYFVTIFGFAFAYFAIGHLPFFPDAFVFSLTSFHGRGFFPGLGSENSLHNPLVIMAAFEAVVGLLIEISFIATFTQRFFGR